jgi:hypothetical protein
LKYQAALNFLVFEKDVWATSDPFLRRKSVQIMVILFFSYKIVKNPVVSHIQKFRDAPSSLTRDTVSYTGEVPSPSRDAIIFKDADPSYELRYLP